MAAATPSNPSPRAGLPANCPKCGQPMDVGFLGLDTARTRWQREVRESPLLSNAEDTFAPNMGVQRSVFRALRCEDCRILLVSYGKADWPDRNESTW